MSIHPTASALIWIGVSLAFCVVSGWALRIFHNGVEAAKRLSDGRRRVYALHMAWDEVIDEAIRFSQHAVSGLLGVLALFVAPQVPRPQPTYTAVFGAIFVGVLFFINVAGGINTVRAVSDWHWRWRFLGGIPPRFPRTVSRTKGRAP